MTSSSSSSTYFQGGDYVELLSAQGKAPAATWKLQGKILKSFEKSIKGNAFQLDGSTDTKMQLPKAATTQSLGLSQRFVVFQLAIPFTRSFAIEIGFSDFQKIRRRFVFASAFREIAMTLLHVQIPLDARVTRDAWINLVFDLHALTETYFFGSTFRSMESICISGSCKLKRVFTMKDAPTCSLAALQQQRQQQVLVVTNAGKRAAAVQVASYADMKDIPKQFVFSSGTPAGPIPTEYFVLATTSGNNTSSAGTGRGDSTTGSRSGSNSTAAPSSSQGRGKSAPTTAQKQKPLLTKKTTSAHPASSSARPETSRRRGNQSPTLPVAPETWEKEQSRPPSASSSARSIRSSSLQQSPGRPSSADAPLHADSCGRSRTSPQSPESPQALVRPSSSSKAQRHQPNHGSLNRERRDLSDSDRENGDEEHEPLSRRSRRFSEDDDRVVASSAPAPLLPVTRSSLQQHGSPSNHAGFCEVKMSKEVHRRAIIAEIQQKLDILSDDDDFEAERNTKLFLQHTSISPASPAPAAPSAESTQLQLDEGWRSPKPTKSIFTFASGRGGSSEDKCDRSSSALKTQRHPRLFDFGSLLDSPVASKESSTERGEGSSTSAVVRASLEKSSSPKSLDREISLREGDDDDDRALAELLVAKRNARRNQQQQQQQQQQTTPADKRRHLLQCTSHEVSPSRSCGQTRLSVDDLTRDSSDVEDNEVERKSEEEQELEGVAEAQEAAGSRSHPSAGADTSESVAATRWPRPVEPHAKSPDRSGGNRDANDAQESDDDSEDNLSIDMTENLDANANGGGDGEQLSERSRDLNADSAGCGHEEQDVGDASDDKCSLASDGDCDCDRSFDFGDLVEEQAREHGGAEGAAELFTMAQQYPAATTYSEMPKSTTLPKSNNAPFDKSESQCTPRLMKINSSIEANRKSTSTALSKQQHEVEFSMSPPRKSLVAKSPPSGGLSFSSSRRLASLLESTDWSQLEPPPPETGVPSTKATTKKQQLGGVPTTSQLAAAAKSSSASIELIFDPLLNCYFDPVANKYYALASE